ncbi:MAG: periplasmic heavy metal sensor [Nitrospirae bacterium]|nr:MAG: periplasmic heavy metal sensor [Nitrospirota bacterium]
MSLLELKEELHLKPEQVEALKPIETDYREVTIKKQADIRVAEVELGALLDQKKPDREALKNKVKEIGALQTDLMQYRIDALLELREALNDEQHEKFKTLLRERMEHFRGSGPMHGMGMMP